MASITVIAKAKLYQKGIKRFLGVEPELEILDKYVRVYYPPGKLKKAQEAYTELVERSPGNVRIDIKPVIEPYYVKKLIPISIGLLGMGFLFGRA